MPCAHPTLHRLLPLLAGLSFATSAQTSDPRAVRGNAFMAQALALHEKLIQGRDIRTQSSLGGYADLPDFYEAIRYTDAASGQLISRIEWERSEPQRVHALEVNVHDAQGRVSRDYTGWYLPDKRHAPRETWVTLHAYPPGLHALRQFNLDGVRSFEKCTGSLQGREVTIELSEHHIVAEDRPGGLLHSPDYRACFASLPLQAGEHAMPH
jgi:hypothetical protein